MDQLVQTHDQRSWDVLRDSKYEFFAIQFPDEHAALMVFHVDSKKGRFPVATFYNRHSGRADNGARRPVYSWPIDGIEIRPDRDSKWTSRRSGNSYYLRQRLRLVSADRSADLTINMAMKDQEFQEEPGGLWDYEGIGDVRGKLNGRSVNGQAFLEMVPSTVAPPALSR
ncbi:MAG: lipocalin family protein [Acidobacteriota bacterium]